MLKDFFKPNTAAVTPITRNNLYRVCSGLSEVIESEMTARGIDAEYAESATGWRLWRVPAAQAHLLPQQDGKPFLGSEDQGYEFFDLTDAEAELYREKDFKGAPWQAPVGPFPVPGSR